jgi:hypothetical protein
MVKAEDVPVGIMFEPVTWSDVERVMARSAVGV